MKRLRWWGCFVAALAAASLGGEQAQAQFPGFSARILDVQQPVNRTSQAILMLNGVGITQAVQQDVTNHLSGGLDYGGNVNTGLFTQNQPYPNGTNIPGDGLDFIVDTWATVTIPAGTWQIAFGSDDGGMVRLEGINFEGDQYNSLAAMLDAGQRAAEGRAAAAVVGLTGNDFLWWENPRGTAWTGGTFTVNAPTTTQFRSVFYERGGGDQLEVIIRNASGGDVIFPPAPTLADGWELLADGALGWSVQTDRDPADGRTDQIAGANRIDVVTRSAPLSNIVRGASQTAEGAVFAQRFNGPNPGNIDDLRTRFTTNDPDSEGLMPLIAWNQWAYPAALGLSGDANNYSVRITGEILVPNSTVQFKDGVDDFTYFAIDLNGDGTIDPVTEVLINDNTWTDIQGQNNGGSPIAFAFFSGSLTGEAAWRRFEFVTAEGGGGDNAFLGWDQNPGAPPFPVFDNDPMVAAHAVPSSHYRATFEPIASAEVRVGLVAGTTVFDVDVGAARWDQIGIFNPDSSVVTTVLDVDGAHIHVNLTADPPDGFTVDLVAQSVNQIVGTPTFSFSHGDEAMWDISQFSARGRLTFGGAPIMGIAGDYNNSGQVEQADLDLVLLNWGQPTPPVPAGWTNDLPIGAIDQEELDKVLLNWGNTAALGGTAAVPEPSTVVLVLVAAALALGLVRKR